MVERSVLSAEERAKRRYTLTPEEEASHDKFQDLRKRVELLETEGDQQKLQIAAMQAALRRANIA